MAEQTAVGFGGLLRQLRGRAKLTQEELAEAASLSPRSVSDLERGINRTAHKDTAELLAGALGLAGPVRGLFVAAACRAAGRDGHLAGGRGVGSGQVLAAERGLDAAAGGGRAGPGVGQMAAPGDPAHGQPTAGAGDAAGRYLGRGPGHGVPVAVGRAG
jgi:transcriptional regulator with XRE-family HTH domain